MKFNLPKAMPEKRREIIESMLDSVISGNSGKNYPEVMDNMPSRKFFIGTLSPLPTKKELESLTNKVAPPAIGLEFLIRKEFSEGATLSILPHGAFYYRVFPSYKEEKEYAEEATTNSAKSSPLRQKYRKIVADLEPIELDISKIISQCQEEGEVVITLKQECERLWEKAKKDPRFFRKKKKGGWRKYPRVPLDCMESEKRYEDYISTDLEALPDCPWGMEIRIEAYETCNGWRFIASFSNASKVIDDPNVENTIFEAGLKISLGGERLKKFKLDYLEENYRHDRLIEAAGINCSAVSNSSSEIEAVSTPIFYEKRKSPAKCEADLKFETLSESPFESLESVGDFLEDRLFLFKEKYSEATQSEGEKEAFRSDLQMMERELRRFHNGVKSLKESAKCLQAFKMMNKSFLYASRSSEEKKFESWYPFQIAFIVSLLPDILHPYEAQEDNYRNHVDLLYYPTGGGKTEAFLGTAVFQAFLDRLMGKNFGVSAMTKFPLRMLSLQQLQRIADIFAQAELVRQEDNIVNGEEFSVGYYVGSSSTPNHLVKYDRVKGKYYDFLDELEQDKNRLEDYQILVKCPFCHERSVELRIDKDRRRILHVCTSEKCGKELPVYISDSEIYRYLPTFIVSTLDKLANVGMQINFRNILGGAKYKCPKHGFSSSQTCVENRSKNSSACNIEPEDMEVVPEGDYSPSLVIQDEMHLVRDTWGTFNSHYETMIDRIISDLSGKGKTVKKIAATATISPSTYTDHVNELYSKEPILFPANLELFTDELEEIARVIVGIMPHGKTHINAVEEVVGSLAVNIQREMDQEKVPKNELKDFWTMLSYHNKRNDAYQMGRSIGTRINENMIKPRGMKELKKETLTGEISFKSIRSIMDSIESEQNYEGTIDALIATSIISHGVDLSSLNLMTFMGMPPNNAEYIQALSRIGRRSIGLAFIVFNPTRERDQSYFKYFRKFHELSDLLIESIPICRWSKRAIERTCPGIFLGTLMDHFDFIAKKKGQFGELKFDKPLKEALTKKAFTVEDVQKFVKECYVPEKSDHSEEISEFIDENVSRHINSILSAATQSSGRDFIGFRLAPKPLRSFRDIDESATVILTPDTYAALKTGIIYSSRGEED